MTTENGNGNGAAKTVKDLVLEHDQKLDEIRSELDKAKGALYIAVALGLVNALPNILSALSDWGPAVATALAR